MDVETDSLTVLSLINAMPEPDSVVELNKDTAGESRDQLPVTPSQASRQESQDMSIKQDSIAEKTDGKRGSQDTGVLKRRGSATEKMGGRRESTGRRDSHSTPRRQDSSTEKVVSWHESRDMLNKRDSITEKMGGRRESQDAPKGRDSVTEKVVSRRESYDMPNKRDSITEKIGEEDHVQEDKKQRDDSKSIKEHDENQPKDSGGHGNL